MVMVMVKDARRGRKRIRLVLRLHVGELCLRSCELVQRGIWWLESVAKKMLI